MSSVAKHSASMAAAAPAPAASDGGERSALQANIAEKGESSYYYAHKARESSVPAGTRVFHGAPKPLAVSGAVKDKPLVVHSIARYAYADGGKTVKVYVEADTVLGDRAADREAWAAANGGEAAGLDVLPVAKAAGEDGVWLEWTEQSVVLEVRLPGVDDGARGPVVRRLRLPRLFDTITAARVRQKPKRLILVLTKEHAGVEWPSLLDK